MAGDIFKVIKGGSGSGGSGTPGKDGNNAFVTWCLHEGIDPLDPTSWDLYIEAITGPAGESAFEEWCQKEGLDPEDPASWELFLSAFKAAPLHLVTGRTVPTNTYKDGRVVYKRLIYVNPAVTAVNTATEIASGLPANVEVWIDPTFSWSYKNEIRETINFNRNSVDRLSFWLEEDKLYAIAPTEEYLDTEAMVCLSFIKLDDEPVDTGDGSVVINIPGRIGEIIATLSNGAIQGALLCDGATYDKADYPLLYEFFSESVPALIVDATKFTVPDLRGEFLRGKATDRVLGSKQLDALQNITGRVAWANTQQIIFYAGAFYDGGPAGNGYKHDVPAVPNTQSGAAFDASRVARTSTETRPQNIAVNYHIRYTTIVGTDVGSGEPGADGANAFEVWLEEQGITDTPETHDDNWDAYMEAIKGEPGDNAFVVWCKENGKDPELAASWDEYMEAIKGEKGDSGSGDGECGCGDLEVEVIEDEVISGGPPVPTDAIGYIIGPIRGVDGADIHLCNYDGDILDGLLPADYFDTHAPWSLIEEVTENGNVMIKIPKYYYKKDVQPAGLEYEGCPRFMISPVPADGFISDGSVYKSTTGSDVDYFLIGKYRARDVGGIAKSQATGTAWSNVTLNNIKTACASNGDGYHLMSYQQYCHILQLLVLEKQTFNPYPEDMRANLVLCRYRGIEEFCYSTTNPNEASAEWLLGIESDVDTKLKLWSRDGLRAWNPVTISSGNALLQFIQELHNDPDNANYFLASEMGDVKDCIIPDTIDAFSPNKAAYISSWIGDTSNPYHTGPFALGFRHDIATNFGGRLARTPSVTPPGDVIGYIVGPTRGPNGADVHLCDINGHILDGLLPADYFDTHMPWSGMVDVVDNGNEMVKVPRYWYKLDTQPMGFVYEGMRRFLISPVEREGFTCDGSVFKDSNGQDVDYFLIGKYRSRNVSGVAKSQSSGSAWGGLTIDAFNSACMANGAGYHGLSYQQWSTIWQLVITEKHTFNVVPQAQRNDPDACQYRGIQEWGYGNDFYEWLTGIRSDANANSEVWSRDGSRTWVATGVRHGTNDDSTSPGWHNTNCLLEMPTTLELANYIHANGLAGVGPIGSAMANSLAYAAANCVANSGPSALYNETGPLTTMLYYDASFSSAAIGCRPAKTPIAPITPPEDTIGYIVGPVRGSNGADIHLCNEDGDILDGMLPSDYFDTHMPWAGMTEVMDSGNAMIKVPRYWYKLDTQPAGKAFAGCRRFLISALEKDGFTCDGSVYKDSNGQDIDHFLIGKYRGRNVGGVAVSQASGNPWGNVTTDSIISACEANGGGFHLLSYQQYCHILQLVVLEKQTFNPYPDSVRADVTQCTYRGIQEFCFGPSTTYIEVMDGLRTDVDANSEVWSRDGLRAWTPTGIRAGMRNTAPYYNNWITAISGDPLLANYFHAADSTSIGSSSSAMLPDIVTSGPSSTLAVSYYASYVQSEAPGAFNMYLSDPSTAAYTSYCGRPVKTPSQPITPPEDTIGYIVGPERGANGADIHICDEDGTILDGLLPADYFDTHMPWSGMVDVQDGDNAMVKVPRYWYKLDTQPSGKRFAGCRRFLISSVEKDGFTCDGSVYKDITGKDVDYFLIGKYRGRNVGGVAVSQASGSGWQTTQATLDNAVSLNGNGYNLMSYQQYCHILQLAVLERQTFNLFPEGTRGNLAQTTYRGIQEFCYGPSSATYGEYVSGITTDANAEFNLLKRDGSRALDPSGVPGISIGDGPATYTSDLVTDAIAANYFLSSAVGSPVSSNMVPDGQYIQSNSVSSYIHYWTDISWCGAFYLVVDIKNLADLNGRPAKTLYTPDPPTDVIGYIVGTTLSANGADIHLCNEDGEILDGLLPADYFDTHSPWKDMVDIQIGYNAMVKVPKYWYKLDTQPAGLPYAGNRRFMISTGPRDGFISDGSVYKDANGDDIDYFLVGKYRARPSGVGTGYYSRESGDPKGNLPIDLLNSGIAAAGEGFHLMSYQQWCHILQLLVLEKQTFNPFDVSNRTDITKCNYRGIQEFGYGPSGAVYAEWVLGIQTNEAGLTKLWSRDGLRNWVQTAQQNGTDPTGSGFLMTFYEDETMNNYFLPATISNDSWTTYTIPDGHWSIHDSVAYVPFGNDTSESGYDPYSGVFALAMTQPPNAAFPNMGGRPAWTHKPRQDVIGYIVGPDRMGEHGADLHWCDIDGNILDDTLPRNWFDTHVLWSNIRQVTNRLGDPMIRIPRYWYKLDTQPAGLPYEGGRRFMISPVPLEGFECDGSVYKDTSGNWQDYFDISKYRIRIEGGTARSNNATPAYSTTFERFEASCAMIDPIYHVMSYQEWCALIQLVVMEERSFNPMPEATRGDMSKCVYRGIQEFCYGLSYNGAPWCEYLSGVATDDGARAKLWTRDGLRGWNQTSLINGATVGYVDVTSSIATLSTDPLVANYFFADSVAPGMTNAMIPDLAVSYPNAICGLMDFNSAYPYHGALMQVFSTNLAGMNAILSISGVGARSAKIGS